MMIDNEARGEDDATLYSLQTCTFVFEREKESYLALFCKKGYLRSTEHLLVYEGANVHGIYDDDEPLEHASEQGHLAIVNLLLEHGANIRANHSQPFAKASCSGRLQVIQLFLEHIKEDKEFFIMMFLYACGHGKPDMVNLYLDPKYNLDINVERSDNQHPTPFSALSIAAEAGNIETARFLIDKGFNIESQRINCYQGPCQNGDIEMMQLLIDKKVFLHRGAALSTACHYGHLHIMKLLWHYAPLKSTSALLRIAVLRGDLEIFKYLLKLESKEEIKHKNGFNIESVMGKGYHQVIEFLLRHSCLEILPLEITETEPLKHYYNIISEPDDNEKEDDNEHAKERCGILKGFVDIAIWMANMTGLEDCNKLQLAKYVLDVKREIGY